MNERESFERIAERMRELLETIKDTVPEKRIEALATLERIEPILSAKLEDEKKLSQYYADISKFYIQQSIEFEKLKSNSKKAYTELTQHLETIKNIKSRFIS